MISAFGVDHGDSISKSALYENYTEGMRRQGGVLNEAAISQIPRKKYKHAGNNVYARERKLAGRRNSREYVKQTVADNKGGENKIYVRTGYAGNLVGLKGLTQGSQQHKTAKVDAYPSLMPTAKNRLKTKYVATHEHQHVKDMAGKKHYDKDIKRAKAYGNQQVKPGKNKFTDTLKDVKRMKHFNEEFQRNRAVLEGKADKAAAKKHNMPSWKATAYPKMARQDKKIFGAGYVKGGGQQLPKTRTERKAGKQSFKEAVQREKGNR